MVEPALAALRHRKDTRVFQHRSVPEILAAVLGDGLGVFGRSVTAELTRAYAPREYTVQFEETDFDFAHRLMEEEGITYYFRHEGGPERMVLADGDVAAVAAGFSAGGGAYVNHETGCFVTEGRFGAYLFAGGKVKGRLMVCRAPRGFFEDPSIKPGLAKLLNLDHGTVVGSGG